MRSSGILMHISSLPSPYGIGTMGKEAYNFVDFLKAAGQSYWQILPVGPTSYGDSPYQSFSTHAGNPYFIDFELLEEDGLLKEEEYADIEWGKNPECVDYEKLYKNRFKVLRKAFDRFKKSQEIKEFTAFLDKNENWISNYGLFMSIKDANDSKSWLEWEEPLKRRDPHSLWEFSCSHRDDIDFWMFLQYEFFKQWKKLKQYANDMGIKIIGDIPIYVSADSTPVWVYPDLFDLDEELNPVTVAGCPPDAFSPTGQLWGNPIYKWERHKETGYSWWIDRIKAARELYDIIRIDHFRGFDSYYAIPYGNETAEDGQWQPGPGIELFQAIEAALGKTDIIAEDLGFLTDSVRELLKESGYPGMRVMEFAFYPESDSEYLPHNYVKNCVAYAGTHDNDTIAGWKKTSDKKDIEFCMEYLHIRPDDNFVMEVLRGLHRSVADTVIVQMQDYLGLGSESRMNTPSVPFGNWQWRVAKKCISPKLAKKIYAMTKLYRR